MVRPSNSCRVRLNKALRFMEFNDIIRYFGALALVLALVGAAGMAVRRFGMPGITGGKGRRLAIVDSLMLGGRHRLYLVRCDSTEHVLVVGPQGATFVNSAPALKTGQPATGEAV